MAAPDRNRDRDQIIDTIRRGIESLRGLGIPSIFLYTPNTLLNLPVYIGDYRLVKRICFDQEFKGIGYWIQRWLRRGQLFVSCSFCYEMPLLFTVFLCRSDIFLGTLIHVSCYNFHLFSECGHKTIILVPCIMHTTHKCTGATNNRHPSRGQALTHSIDGTGGGLNFPSAVYAQNELFGGECEQAPQLIIQWKFVRPCVRLSGLNATGIYMCGTHGCYGCFHCACSIHCK